METPNKSLIYAAQNGHKEMVEALLAKGANIDHCNKDGNSALIHAVAYGHNEIVKVLLAKGAKVNHGNKDGDTALMFAVEKGNQFVVNALIKKGADVNHGNKDGDTALMFAVVKGKQFVVNDLINRGSKVDLANQKGKTALMYAVQKNHYYIVNDLINRGADVTLADQGGKTALMYAAEYGDKNVIQALIKNRAKVDLADQGGKTALMYAVHYGQKDVVKELIEKGADVTLPDKAGKTALDYAESEQIKEVFVQHLTSKNNMSDKEIKLLTDNLNHMSENSFLDIIKKVKSQNLKDEAKELFIKKITNEEKVTATIEIIDKVISDGKSISDAECQEIYKMMEKQKLVPSNLSETEKKSNINKIKEVTNEYINEHQSHNILRRAVRSLLHFIGVKYIEMEQAKEMLKDFSLPKELIDGQKADAKVIGPGSSVPHAKQDKNIGRV